MSGAAPTLYMLCGKIAAGKSTLAARLADQTGAVLITQDTWLGGLYADEMTTLADYVRCAARLEAVMGPHVISVLRAGVSVVLDFPANTIEARGWMRSIFEAAGAGHELHLLEPPDAVCLARLHTRNAAGEHPFSVTDAQFQRISVHFTPPMPSEGFTVIRHGDGL